MLTVTWTKTNKKTDLDTTLAAIRMYFRDACCYAGDDEYVPVARMWLIRELTRVDHILIWKSPEDALAGNPPIAIAQ